MKTVLTTLLLSMFSIPAHADVTDKDIAICAAKEGDLTRLECYDELARRNGLDGPQRQDTHIEEKGEWIVRVETNPIDDSNTVYLSLFSDTGKNRWGHSPVLTLRCQSNKTELYINWNDYLGRKANVLTRVGENKAMTQNWGLSTDSKATFHPKAISFIKDMMKSGKMVAQITPYNESPVTAIFNTQGLDNAIQPLRETCNW